MEFEDAVRALEEGGPEPLLAQADDTSKIPSEPEGAEGTVSPTDQAGEASPSLVADQGALSDVPTGMSDRVDQLVNLSAVSRLIEDGGPAIWAITALAVVTLAIILWKIWRLMLQGAWRRARAEAAVEHWCSGDDQTALQTAQSGRGIRSRVAAAAIRATLDRSLTQENAREETVRVAKRELSWTKSGLRALELISTIAPLLGLLGTVLGMIEAFQQLQAAGSRADPSALAGGIWEALLTTAAGMAVAIPASAALTWFESVTANVQNDLEDIASRVLNRPVRPVLAHAAE